MPSAMTALLLAILLSADEAPAVPLELQVELLGKVLQYDRGFLAHGAEEVVILVVHLDAASSLGAAHQLMATLRTQESFAGVAHREELVAFHSSHALAELVEAKKARVVIFSPGFSAIAAPISAALDGKDVLTVSTTQLGVREGLVLGFDLVAGRPRMLINLAQARRQQADFRAEVLRLMTVYQ